VPVAHICNPSDSGGRITVWSKWQIVCETLSRKTYHKKGLVELFKGKALSSNPSTAKNKKSRTSSDPLALVALLSWDLLYYWATLSFVLLCSCCDGSLYHQIWQCIMTCLHSFDPLIFFSELGMGPRALCMVSKCSTTVLHPQPPESYFLIFYLPEFLSTQRALNTQFDLMGLRN
jgi:hypothetical protein